MNRLLLISLFFFTNNYLSLSQGPSANFIWSPNPACVGLPVCFIDSSSPSALNIPIGYWSWNFSDGTISSSQNPTHIFNASGGYMVTLTILDTLGNVDDTTIWVPVDNCSTPCSSNGLNNYPTPKRLLKTFDLLGRDSDEKKNQHLFYIFDDGLVEKRIIIE